MLATVHSSRMNFNLHVKFFLCYINYIKTYLDFLKLEKKALLLVLFKIFHQDISKYSNFSLPDKGL